MTQNPTNALYWKKQHSKMAAAYFDAMVELEKVDHMAHKISARGVGGMTPGCSICEAMDALMEKHGRPQEPREL